MAADPNIVSITKFLWEKRLSLKFLYFFVGLNRFQEIHRWLVNYKIFKSPWYEKTSSSLCCVETETKAIQKQLLFKVAINSTYANRKQEIVE